jgi:hypothetical protein
LVVMAAVSAAEVLSASFQAAFSSRVRCFSPARPTRFSLECSGTSDSLTCTWLVGWCYKWCTLLVVFPRQPRIDPCSHAAISDDAMSTTTLLHTIQPYRPRECREISGLQRPLSTVSIAIPTHGAVSYSGAVVATQTVAVTRSIQITSRSGA